MTIIKKILITLKRFKGKHNRFNINGNRDGYWEVYYSNGNLWYKGWYKNGKREGYWEEYYPDGILWFKGFYARI